MRWGKEAEERRRQSWYATFEAIITRLVFSRAAIKINLPNVDWLIADDKPTDWAKSFVLKCRKAWSLSNFCSRLNKLPLKRFDEASGTSELGASARWTQASCYKRSFSWLLIMKNNSSLLIATERAKRERWINHLRGPIDESRGAREKTL
jgi:hypothetical protein